MALPRWGAEMSCLKKICTRMYTVQYVNFEFKVLYIRTMQTCHTVASAPLVKGEFLMRRFRLFLGQCTVHSATNGGFCLYPLGQ